MPQRVSNPDLDALAAIIARLSATM